MAQLFFDNQFCQNHAEAIEESVASYLDARAVQEFGKQIKLTNIDHVKLTFTDAGCVEASFSCFTSNVAVARTQTDQESSAILRAQVAAMWAPSPC